MRLLAPISAVLFIAAALTVVTLGPSDAQANVGMARTCSPPSHIGSDAPNMGEIYPDGATSCALATKAIANGHLNKGGNLVTAGWKCRASHKLDQTGLILGATISCVKGAGNKYVFVFSWST